MQNSDLALERLARLCISLENERALNDDPKWSGKKTKKYKTKDSISINYLDSHYGLANYKKEPCNSTPRLCRQGYAC